MFQHCRITPHFLEPVEFPVFRMHHMHHHIHIIDQYPLQVLGAFMMEWFFPANLAHFILHIIRNSPDLRLTAGFTDDKKISHRFFDLPEIKGDQVLPFFFLDRRNNGFDDF